jgi:hypothetical protein
VFSGRDGFRGRRFSNVEGWRVKVEEEFEIEIAGATVRGMVDRIDERDGAIRALDYKTLRSQVPNKASVPSHLDHGGGDVDSAHPDEVDDTRVSLVIGAAKKASDYLWKDLQPLRCMLGEVSDLGYYVLGSSEGRR